IRTFQSRGTRVISSVSVMNGWQGPRGAVEKRAIHHQAPLSTFPLALASGPTTPSPISPSYSGASWRGAMAGNSPRPTLFSHALCS
ncbi:unnamed protein product, partial [Closterium sp. NIES-64]